MHPKAAYLALNGFCTMLHGGCRYRIFRGVGKRESMLYYDAVYVEGGRSEVDLYTWGYAMRSVLTAYTPCGWDVITPDIWDRLEWPMIHKICKF